MSNILVVDTQKGFINDSNKSIVLKINEYLKSNEFNHVIYTKFVTHHKDNTYKNIFWDGLYEKDEQKIAVKKLTNSKVFKKKSHGLPNTVLKYIKENNIKDIEICGVDNDGAINLICLTLKNLGVNVNLLTSLVCKSSLSGKRDKVDYITNLIKTANGFYVGDMIGGAYKAKMGNDEFPYVNNKTEFSDCTVLSMAVIEWLLGAKYEPREMLKILSYYYKFYPNKNDAVYNKNYALWAQNGCRSYRICNDNVAVRMCSPIGWFASTLQQIDELIVQGIVPVNNSQDAQMGARLICYIIWYMRKGVAKNELIKFLKRHFDENIFVGIEKSLKNLQYEQNATNTAILAIMTFVETKSYEEALKKVLEYNIESEALASIVSALAEVYYKNLPFACFNNCKQLLPEKLKKLLGEFGKLKQVKLV
ncbi:MAG: isochorismatase family protein [Clostridia bacterium]|nr:isochorismatase family protein [Clostridia bacterium]